MKKLYLTSFTFTTGTEVSFTEIRLVVITKNEIEDFRRKSNINYEYDPGLYAAQEKAANWFVKNYPNSQVISITSHPAIEDNYYANYLTKEKPPLVFELAFGINEIPPVDDPESGITRDVVIDLHGTRENFCIGHYHFKSKSWKCYSKETIHEEMHWTDILPLSSKDK